MFAAIIAYRVHLLLIIPFNPDEFFTLGSVFCANRGMLPFIDSIDVHPPLLFSLLQPVMLWLGERADFIDWFRALFLVLNIALYVAIFSLVGRTHGRRAAAWAVTLLNAFGFFLLTSTHVRHDTPGFLMLFISLFPLLTADKRYHRPLYSAVAGLLAGWAVSLHMTVVFPALAVGMWLLIARRGDKAVLHALSFGASLIAAFLSTYLLMFGGQFFDALAAHRDMLFVEHIYQQVGRFNTMEIFYSLLHHNALAWLIVATALIGGHARLLGTAAKGGSSRLLYLLLLDFGLIFLLVRDHNFPQHYYHLALFGSIVAAVDFNKWRRQSAGERSRRIGYIVFVFLLFATGISIWHIEREQRNVADRTAEFVSAFPKATATPHEIRRWMLDHDEMHDPFSARTKAFRQRQLEYILSHTQAGDRVVTDFLNPPYRPLPAAYHHGNLLFMIMKAPSSLRQDPRAQVLRRIDPTWDSDESVPDARLLALFAERPPLLILLDGTWAGLYVSSNRFRDWLAENYSLQVDEKSSSVFALRRDADTVTP